MTVLHVAAIDGSVSNNDRDVVTNGASVVSQECLLSSNDKGSGALGRLLPDKLDSLSGEGLERIVEVDQSGVLALLDESGADLHVGGNEAVLSDVGLPSCYVERVVWSELQQSSSKSVRRRVPSGLDVAIGWASFE